MDHLESHYNDPGKDNRNDQGCISRSHEKCVVTRYSEIEATTVLLSTGYSEYKTRKGLKVFIFQGFLA